MNRHSIRGHAMVEFAMLSPWVLFLFVGALDWGFYSYALIATQSAARIAAEYTSGSLTTAGDTTGACGAALGAMRKLPNVGSVVTTCNADPVTVTATSLTGPDGQQASRVSVRYRGIPLFPIPGLLMGRISVTSAVKMRIRSVT